MTVASVPQTRQPRSRTNQCDREAVIGRKRRFTTSAATMVATTGTGSAQSSSARSCEAPAKTVAPISPVSSSDRPCAWEITPITMAKGR